MMLKPKKTQAGGSNTPYKRQNSLEKVIYKQMIANIGVGSIFKCCSNSIKNYLFIESVFRLKPETFTHMHIHGRDYKNFRKPYI